MRALISPLLVLAALTAGCGGGSASTPAGASTATPAAVLPAQTTPLPAATTTQAAAPAATTTAATSVAPAATTPAAAPTTDCTALGISRQKLREGACTNGRLAVYVANKGTTVALPELSARLNGVGLQPGRGGQLLANLSVTVTNNLRRAVAFDALGDQTLLTLGDRRYPEDVAVERSAGAGVAKRAVAIPHGASQTVNLVYAIPRSEAHRLATVGALVVSQFSDAGRSTPRRRVAVLRTYR